MKINLGNKWLAVGLFLGSVSMLTACNTVQGTAEGARQDVQTVSQTHKKHHHKKMMMNRQSTPSKSNETNTSY